MVDKSECKHVAERDLHKQYMDEEWINNSGPGCVELQNITYWNENLFPDPEMHNLWGIICKRPVIINTTLSNFLIIITSYLGTRFSTRRTVSKIIG